MVLVSTPLTPLPVNGGHLHLYTTEGECDVGQVHVQQGHTAHCFLETTGIDPAQWKPRMIYV
jgi:hypothetical protein